MFVKVIQDENTAIYECEKAFTKTLIDGRGKSMLLTVVNGTENQMEIEIKQGSKVFVMNNEGQTIDRYK